MDKDIKLIHEGAVIDLMEAIFKTIGEDYKILWYIKTHVKDGGLWVIDDKDTKKLKRKYFNQQRVTIPGVCGTVNDELKNIEDYIHYIIPDKADAIIDYLRKEYKDEHTMRFIKRIKIA